MIFADSGVLGVAWVLFWDMLALRSHFGWRFWPMLRHGGAKMAAKSAKVSQHRRKSAPRSTQVAINLCGEGVGVFTKRTSSYSITRPGALLAQWQTCMYVCTYVRMCVHICFLYLCLSYTYIQQSQMCISHRKV